MENRKYIELKQRMEGRGTQSMAGFVSFTAHTLSEESLDELALISQCLNKVGITLQIERRENIDAGTSFDFVTLKVNEKRFNESTTRHAGRKPNFAEKYDKYGECTVAELQEKIKCESKTKIAEELGCHRMTLYRILKNISEMNPDRSMSIWHFTS